jgi:beta-phosphoglucomutase
LIGHCPDSEGNSMTVAGMTGGGVFMQASALIFDMDGTLVDNMPWHQRTWFQIFAEVGMTMSETEYHQRLHGRDNQQIYRELYGRAAATAEADAFGNAKEARYRALYQPHLQALPGLIGFLGKAQAAGYAMAVATSAISDNIDFILDGLDLRRFFSVVVGCQDVTNSKPAPDLYLEAARQLQVPPERCLAFEDSRSGITAARAAGMPVVAICTGLSPETAITEAGVVAAWPDYLGQTLPLPIS